MKLTAAVLFAFVFGIATVAHAQWSIVSDQSEFSRGRTVEHRRILLQHADRKAAVDLAVFLPKKTTLRVIDNPQLTDSLAEAMAREECLAGVNGGYFDPDHAPIGLMISGGAVLAPPQKARLLSGVVSATSDRVQIQRSAEFSLKAKPSAARQCGPFLVERGKAIASLNNTRGARRTFVATLAGDGVALGSCSYVTLAELATVLAAPELKVQRALNLDGGSSTAFWFAGENGTVSIREGKTVRDFIGVAAK